MERAIAEIIVEECQNDGLDVNLYEGYSGRGMYGKETTGITVDDLGEFMAMLATNPAVAERIEETGQSHTLRTMQTDSLGRSTIIY